jgi:hypothetical protein
MDNLHKNLDQILATFERNIIEKTLRDTHGNQSKAARALGISRRKIQYKIGKYGVDCNRLKEHRSTDNETFFSWYPLSSTGHHDSRDDQSLPLP